MPSANKTPNLDLNQWQGNEYVKRQDFVDDNSKIDTYCKSLSDKVDNQQTEIDTIIEDYLEQLKKKRNEATKVDVIMEPGKWSDKVYSFEDTYPASQYDFTLELKFECTPQEEDAYYKASMRGGDTTVNRVRARGTQPTINIPVVLVLTKKAGAI